MWEEGREGGRRRKREREREILVLDKWILKDIFGGVQALGSVKRLETSLLF